MAHHVDARYDEQDGMFVPPIRTLGFNPQLTMNDSLLVQSYIEAYDISYPEALRRIESEVAELKAHLDTEGSYELNDLGVLALNSEGHLEFQPCEAGIITPWLYGLSSFEMKPLQKAEERPTEQHREMPDESAITIKMSWLRNALAVAAAVIAFLMIGTPVGNSKLSADVQQSAFVAIPHHSDAAASSPVLSKEKAESPASASQASENYSEAAAEVAVADEPSTGFCIVMASQVTERNAKAFIAQLSDKGFADARILVSGSNKIRRVVYGYYDTEEEAASTLHQLRSESRLFRETWIMEIQ